MPFFASPPRERPRARLRKKSVGDQPVDNNTYTPNAIESNVGRLPLQRRKSTDSISSTTSLPAPPKALSQIRRGTLTFLGENRLLNIRNHSAPMILNIGKPKFPKRNDSPIHRFPSQKEELLADGTEKLVQLEGDVIPGPGVNLQGKAPQPEPEPEIIEEEPKRVLKVVNLPDLDVKPAFEEIPRIPSPPPRPLPLAAFKPTPVRRETLPVEATTQVATLPTISLAPVAPAQQRRSSPNYRGVPAFRPGGSVPGPSPIPRDSRPLPGMPTRSKTTKVPALRVIPASPLSHEINPDSPPYINKYLVAPHIRQDGYDKQQYINGGLQTQETAEYRSDARIQRKDSLKELARAAEARNMMATRSEFEKLQQQNLELHNRIQALEENTLSDNRLLLSRILALEKANLAINQQHVANVNGPLTDSASRQVGVNNELAALQQDIISLQKTNETLVALVADLEQQKHDLIKNADSEAEKNSRIIEALETQNTVDRKRAREEKETLQQHLQASEDKHIKETTNLRKRITTLETECTKHALEIKSKEEKLTLATKENENLRKEIKVLWTEISDISKKVESGNAKKIAHLEAELAAASKEIASDAVVKENLKKEVEVLWAEIRDMHEKRKVRAKGSKSDSASFSFSESESGKSIGSVVTVKNETERPQSPQIDIPATTAISTATAAVEHPPLPVSLRIGEPGTSVSGSVVAESKPLPESLRIGSRPSIPTTTAEDAPLPESSRVGSRPSAQATTTENAPLPESLRIGSTIQATTTENTPVPESLRIGRPGTSVTENPPIPTSLRPGNRPSSQITVTEDKPIPESLRISRPGSSVTENQPLPESLRIGSRSSSQTTITSPQPIPASLRTGRPGTSVTETKSLPESLRIGRPGTSIAENKPLPESLRIGRPGTSITENKPLPESLRIGSRSSSITTVPTTQPLPVSMRIASRPPSQTTIPTTQPPPASLRPGRPATPLLQRQVASTTQPSFMSIKPRTTEKPPQETTYPQFRQGSNSSVRFRPTAVIPIDAPSTVPAVRGSKLPLPTAPPAVNGARFGYGPSRKKRPAASGAGRMGKPPG